MKQMLVKRIVRATKNFFKRCAPMAMLAALLNFGIAAGVVAGPSPAPVEARLEPLSNFPQTTLSILTPDARQHVFNIWLADTEAHREQGLMFVKSLEPNTGMLFIFDEPQIVTMWMKNTLISLDMVFIDKNGHVTRV